MPRSSRIYLPGSNFPGLTMSRAFGDTACKGVVADPEYHSLLMQPDDQWYCIVASDGIWEFMEGQEVCNMTSKKLRLKGPRETLRFVTAASGGATVAVTTAMTSLAFWFNGMLQRAKTPTL